MNLNEEEKLKIVLSSMKKEFYRATRKFGSFHNAHEGYAVLLEEVDELWENVKLNQSILNRNEKMMREAIQVGAMAIRFIMDCIRIGEGLD